MTWNHRIRQIHRWLSVLFTLAVLATFVALAQAEPIVWVSCLPLGPLALLWFSGAYLFAQPYAERWRGQRRGA